MKILYDRKKRVRDRVVRYYLTLNCNSNCWYCSALIPKVSVERKKIFIPAEIWAEGLNRRNRYTILAGGEPFLYPEFPKLISLLNTNYKIEIYTNLGVDVRPFLNACKKTYPFLISLHSTIKNFDKWYKQVRLLTCAGHSVRFHVVRRDNCMDRIRFLMEKGHKVTGCDDQNNYNKSKGEESNKLYPKVKCTMCNFLFGADGYRYICVGQMGKGNEWARLEHISEPDGNDCNTVECDNFGYCAGCDNLCEGQVIYEK